MLLLDEIEKAHPDVFNLLLQVMDHGTLTDNNGRKADFRNVVLVMTTNAGAGGDRRAAPSASPSRTTPPTAWRPSSASSRPEFRNRLDAMIQFRSLGYGDHRQVVDKFIFELEQQLIDKKVSLSVDAGGAGLDRREGL